MRHPLDLGGLIGFHVLAGPLRPLVVGVGSVDEQLGLGGAVRGRGRRLGVIPLALDGLAMHLQAACERLDRRQQPLLQADHEQTGRGLRAVGCRREAGLAGTAVLVEQPRQLELRRLRREVVDDKALDPARREAALDLADVLLEPPDHHVVERLAATHLDAAREARRVEQLKQRREAVGVAVVRRGREEQAMLEARAEVAHRAGELRLDAVPAAARRSGVVRLVEDQQAAGKHRTEPRAHRVGVRRIGEQVVRDEKAAVRGPGVDAEAALAAHSAK